MSSSSSPSPSSPPYSKLFTKQNDDTTTLRAVDGTISIFLQVVFAGQNFKGKREINHSAIPALCLSGVLLRTVLLTACSLCDIHLSQGKWQPPLPRCQSNFPRLLFNAQRWSPAQQPSFAVISTSSPIPACKTDRADTHVGERKGKNVVHAMHVVTGFWFKTSVLGMRLFIVDNQLFILQTL